MPASSISSLDQKSNRSSYRLFLDLDGVLANFNQGIYQITGQFPDQLKIRDLWRAAAKADGFFTHLPWMPEGRILWEATRILNPVILTGLPHGNWAESQKREWCARELGSHVPVVTCMAKDKIKYAKRFLDSSEVPVLVDDRPKHRAIWEEQGGVFITHTSVSRSLDALVNLGFDLQL